MKIQADERALRDGRCLLRLEFFPRAGEPEHFALYFDQQAFDTFLDSLHTVRKNWREGTLRCEEAEGR